MSGIKKPNINLGEAAEIVDMLIPDTKPTTKAGRVFRWIDKIAKIIRGIKTAKEIIK